MPFPDPGKDGMRGYYVSVVLLKESVVFVEGLTLLMSGFMMYEDDDCMQAWCWFTVIRHSWRPKIRRSSGLLFGYSDSSAADQIR